MAVNKNFVVKNGLEVNDDLILANPTNSRVGIGTSVPQYTLHAFGGIGATSLHVAGVSTFLSDVRITGVTTLASAGGITTTGGDFYVGGDLYVLDDVVYDEVTGRHLDITGVGTINRVVVSKDILVSAASTFTGISTFGKSIHIDKDVNIGAGATVVGTLTVGGDLNVTGDLSYDEVTGRNINITGVGTITRLNTTDIVSTSSTITRLNWTDAVGTSATITRLNATDAVVSGILTATSFTGSAQVAVSSEGTYIGAGASVLNFTSSTGTAWQVTPAGTSGIATIQVTPGASLGLAIALGG